jgi:hypothetical protein
VVERVGCIESWRVQYIGVGRPSGGGTQGETLGRQPLVPWLLRQPLWARLNTHAGDGPTPCD